MWYIRVIGIAWIAREVSISILWKTSELRNALIAAERAPCAKKKQILNSWSFLGSKVM
jgi:hypothetical protein